MSSRRTVASLGWTTVSMSEVESRPTMAKAAANVVSDILARLSLKVLYVRGCFNAKSLLHLDQEVGLSLNLMKRPPESNATISIMERTQTIPSKSSIVRVAGIGDCGIN